MVPLLVVLTIVVFVIVDVVTRLTLRHLRETKLKTRRQEALDIGLNLDYTDEAHSLKRVEVDEPRARILAVDDEAIVLDSFRKILVLAGYSVDTVETGQEAVGLLRKPDSRYDFVFTDLKMPEFDGLDVVKAVKHLRPEIDVVMITGYATIESAVDAMKFGAMDYVQKPFTADELVDFTEKLVFRREDRLRREAKPGIHLVTPTIRATSVENEFNVPSGVFFTRSHTWIDIQPDGLLLIGLDDFAEKMLGAFDGVELPDKDSPIEKGDPLFTIWQDGSRITLPSPASGSISFVNNRLPAQPDLINSSPFKEGWVCAIDPTNLPGDLQTFRIGADAVAWYEEEVERFARILEEGKGDGEASEMDRWNAFSKVISTDPKPEGEPA